MAHQLDLIEFLTGVAPPRQGTAKRRSRTPSAFVVPPDLRQRVAAASEAVGMTVPEFVRRALALTLAIAEAERGTANTDA